MCNPVFSIANKVYGSSSTQCQVHDPNPGYWVKFFPTPFLSDRFLGEIYIYLIERAAIQLCALALMPIKVIISICWPTNIQTYFFLSVGSETNAFVKPSDKPMQKEAPMFTSVHCRLQC